MKNTINIEGCHYMKCNIKKVYIWCDDEKIDHDFNPDFKWRLDVLTIDKDRSCYMMGDKDTAEKELERILQELNE